MPQQKKRTVRISGKWKVVHCFPPVCGVWGKEREINIGTVGDEEGEGEEKTFIIINRYVA